MTDWLTRSTIFVNDPIKKSSWLGVRNWRAKNAFCPVSGASKSHFLRLNLILNKTEMSERPTTTYSKMRFILPKANKWRLVPQKKYVFRNEKGVTALKTTSKDPSPRRKILKETFKIIASSFGSFEECAVAWFTIRSGAIIFITIPFYVNGIALSTLLA